MHLLVVYTQESSDHGPPTLNLSSLLQPALTPSAFHTISESMAELSTKSVLKTDFSHETLGDEVGMRRPSRRQTEKSKFTWFQIYTLTFFFPSVSQLWLGIYSCYTILYSTAPTTTTEHWRLYTFTDRSFLEFPFFHSSIPFPFLGRPLFFFFPT